MRICIFALSIIVLNCSSPKTDSTNTIEDSLQESLSITLPEQGSLSYVGLIYKFEDNNTFYTDLYFLDGFDYNMYDQISNMLDVVVFSDEEVKRTRLNLKSAQQYFNLSGLKTIDIYNERSEKVASGNFSHIEYVEDLIESRFVAVFSVSNPDITEYSYCIGNPNAGLKAVNWKLSADKNLKKSLLSLLSTDTSKVFNFNQYTLNNESIYTTLSIDTLSFIVNTNRESSQVVYKSVASESILNLIAISKDINGMPVLLTESALPESDYFWSSLLIFNGAEYEVSKDHRIKN